MSQGKNGALVQNTEVLHISLTLKVPAGVLLFWPERSSSASVREGGKMPDNQGPKWLTMLNAVYYNSTPPRQMAIPIRIPLLRFLSIMLVAAICATLSPSGSVILLARGPLPPSDTVDILTPLDSEESRLIRLINEYRQQNGESTLSASLSLYQAAEWMANDEWSCHDNACGWPSPRCLHSDSESRCITERVQSFGYPGNWATEVLYAGSEYADSALNWWKDSPDHNEQLLRSDVSAIGVGRAWAPPNADDVWIWVANLGPVTTPGDLISGDLNEDCAVDIFDLVIIGSSFGLSPGDPGYDPRADANASGGAIDIFDLVVVGSHFGDTCSETASHFSSSASPQTTTVRLEPQKQTINEEDEAGAVVEIVEVSNLYGFQLDFVYDPSILEYVSWEPGPFLGGGYWVTPDPSTSGVLKNIAATRTTPGEAVTGTGALVTVTLRALSGGISAIRIENLRLADSEANEIPFTAKDGEIQVLAAPIYLPIIVRNQ